MSNPRDRRLAREIRDCAKDTSSEIIVKCIGESLDHLIGSFPGPTGTSYEGGLFEVSIEPPANYPFSPLVMKFITRVYHPNISSATGMICLDILKGSWSPVYTVKTAMISLQSLLSTPEASDPQDAVVAQHYLTDRSGFEATAKYWTKVYAKGGQSAPVAPSSLDETLLAGLDPKHVAQFVDIGFEYFSVIEVMKGMNYRGSNATSTLQEAVIEKLLSLS